MRNGLASVAWLAERLGQPNLRVVDATWFLPNSPEKVSEGGRPMLFDDLASFLQWDATRSNPHGFAASSGIDDVAQLCGGAGDTALLLIRRGWRSGPKFRHNRRLQHAEARSPETVHTLSG